MALEQVITDRYGLYLGDCIEVMGQLKAQSIDLSMYSPPFGGLYTYSSDERDLSNCLNHDEFWEHYRFVIDGIARLTKPGRVSAVHCTDIPSGNSGLDHLYDFSSDIIEEHVHCQQTSCQASTLTRRKGLCGHGWFEFVARYHVWKEPLTVRNRTMTKSLSHKALTEDSTRCSIANADQLLIFRRKGTNAVPVSHPTGLTEYIGSKHIPTDILQYRNYRGNQIENRYSQWVWRQYASAFWDDIRLDRVLPHKPARDEEDEKHVHPLQLDVIERGITLWSNPDDIVLTPFMGVGSEVFGALSMGRRALGIELKPSYFAQAVNNIQAVTSRVAIQEDLFAPLMLALEEASA